MVDVPSSSTTRRWMYDVFLSFRGEDTRQNFTKHLYDALDTAGVNTFRDDVELRQGDAVGSELVVAIKKSRIAVVVFSDGYADSQWCLGEIAEIMDCRTVEGQLVLPIFYEVDPSDVRKQKGRFAAAFEKHEKRFGVDSVEVLRWRAALREAASLSGWDLRQLADGHEGKFITKIVERVQSELRVTYLEVAIYPVGIDVRLKHLISLMAISTNHSTLVLGIYGMSGIGKTTLSKALFNHFFHFFNSRSFLPSINSISNSSPDALLRLQQTLLSDLLIATNLRSRSSTTTDSTVVRMQERLQNKKVLVVLDDLDRIEQANALAIRDPRWFGKGSRIIITTRNKQILDILKVDKVYNMESNPLNDEESLELFSYHAFREQNPPEELLECSKSIVSYCGNLPLALEILGGSFFGGRPMEEWRKALERLKMIPAGDLQEKLRLGFEGLRDEMEREIFLDVCCYFVGMKEELVVKIMDGCGMYGESGLRGLKWRCLVGVEIWSGRLKMHDLVRDMGREIVRQTCVKEPARRSRVWLYHEALKILLHQTGTENIEGLAIDMGKGNKEKFKLEAFGKMRNLRLLKLNYVNLIGTNFEQIISKELRWICWHGFPLKSIPSSFYQGNLVAIDMRHSSLIHPWTWRDSQILENLKVLNLSHSQKLKKSPNFTKLPNLEQLKLKNCTALSSLHPSIGQLCKVHLINLQNCTNLSSLPTSIYNLHSLQTFIISGCSKIDRLHDDLGHLESLTTLLADRTAISHIPFSIVKLKKLTDLSLCGCNSRSGSGSSALLPWRLVSWALPRPNQTCTTLTFPSSLKGLSSLTELSLQNCNLDSLPIDIGSLSELKRLNLGGNKNLTVLGTEICGLSKLKELNVENCGRLEFIQGFPKNMRSFCATNCKSLVRTPDISTFERAPNMVLTNCCALLEVCGLDKLECSSNIRMAGCSNLSTDFRMSLLEKWSGDGLGSLCIAGNQLPKCLHFFTTHPPLTFQVPNINNILLGLTIFAIFTHLITDINHSPSLRLINKTSSQTHQYRMLGLHYDSINIHAQHTWAIHLPFSYGYRLNPGDDIELHIPNANAYGVRLAYHLGEPQPIESFAPSMAVEEQGGASNGDDNDDSTYHVLDQQMESGSNTSPWLLLRYSFIISILVLGLSLILMIQW
ncbi:hypothetical protein IC582_011079 [Cucumis melo]|uniref:TMV resistance protein N-like n=1 Tax=Cucumis melo var. makuwa TaxID=1194695 RepID=A0A5D3C8K6_CUCMM|nr:TMV resistance protein N-like [Cucumis melo var. makuwa]TYK07622.1 TMV resistance protein N-like [Cucumis melo var. makuwa]